MGPNIQDKRRECDVLFSRDCERYTNNHTFENDVDDIVNDRVLEDEVDDIVKAILENEIFGVDGILNHPAFDGKQYLSSTTDCTYALDRFSNLTRRANATMACENIQFDGHVSTGCNGDTIRGSVDKILHVNASAYPHKNIDTPNPKTDFLSPPSGKVKRKLLKEDSASQYATFGQVPKNLYASCVSPIIKIPKNPPKERVKDDIERTPSSCESNPNTNSAKERTLFTYKNWDSEQNRWRRTKSYKAKVLGTCAPAKNETSTAAAPHCFHIPLVRGGNLNIFPNLVDPKEVNEVKKELLDSKFWRKYSIQGGDEPRLHFLAHEDATDDFEDKPQPGYRYANITMKARPLSSVPKLQQLSNDLASLRNIPNGKWNIGIHPVLYRDNKDSMGDHADDDQGETRIFCVLLDSPPTTRKVVVKVFDKLTGGKRAKDRVHHEGDEFIELRLRPGDAYEMDGLMQKSYSHSVPKDSDNFADESIDKRVKNEKSRRICVVLRTGDQKYFDKDTGAACIDLSPRPPIKYICGHIDGLREGDLYTRRELRKMNAFQLPQRGISGTYESGADAIIVSGKRCGWDNIENLKYKLGTMKLPFGRGQNCLSGYYRYDGLYRIVAIQTPADPLGAFEFYMKRSFDFSVPKPPLTLFLPKASFEDTANELFPCSKKRRVPSCRENAGKRPTRIQEIGPKGFSWCVGKVCPCYCKINLSQKEANKQTNEANVT